MKPPIFRIALLLSLVWFGQFHRASSALLDCGQTEQALHVRGLITQTNPSRTNGMEPQIKETDFDLWFTGKKWRAKLKEHGKADSFGYSEAGTDGEFFYRIRAFDTNTPRRTINNASGSILDDTIPVDDFSEAWRVWLPYASGCYLKELQDTKLPTFFNYLAKHGFTLPSIWRQEEQFPFSLRELVCVNPGIGFGVTQNGSWITMKTGPSYTNFAVVAQSFTNVGRWRIPLTFTMERYGVNRTGATNSEVVKSSWEEGRTTEVELVDAGMDFRPPVPDKTAFEDQRREAVEAGKRDPRKQGISVIISGSWPSIDSPETPRVADSPAPRQQPSAPPPPDPPKRSSRSVVAAFAAVFLVLITVGAIMAWRRDRAYLNSSR